MNIKIITISLATVLGVAGGAYMLMNSNVSLTQYVPESISSFISDTDIKANADEHSDFVDNAPAFIDEKEEQVEVEKPTENSEQIAESFEQVSVEEAVVEKQSSESIEKVTDTAESSPEDQVYEEIAESINKSISSEEISIAEQIQATNNEIYRLTAENKELEALFQQILRQNRLLAEKLRELDGKIAAFN